jgi:hypothetical protein
MMTVFGDNLDGIRVVWVGRFWLQGAFVLTEVVADIFTVFYPGNGKLYYVDFVMILWPDADAIAAVFDAKVFLSFHFGGLLNYCCHD